MGGGRHGFLDTGGIFTAINVPGAVETETLGINDSGQIVGLFIDAKETGFGEHGFLDTGGAFTAINVPGTLDTLAFGINGSGQIAGEFIGFDGVAHGFIATPAAAPVPEPSSSLTLATGLVALLAMVWYRKRVGLWESLTELTSRRCI